MEHERTTFLSMDHEVEATSKLTIKELRKKRIRCLEFHSSENTAYKAKCELMDKSCRRIFYLYAVKMKMRVYAVVDLKSKLVTKDLEMGQIDLDLLYFTDSPKENVLDAKSCCVKDVLSHLFEDTELGRIVYLSFQEFLYNSSKCAKVFQEVYEIKTREDGNKNSLIKVMAELYPIFIESLNQAPLLVRSLERRIHEDFTVSRRDLTMKEFKVSSINLFHQICSSTMSHSDVSWLLKFFALTNDSIGISLISMYQNDVVTGEGNFAQF